MITKSAPNIFRYKLGIQQIRPQYISIWRQTHTQKKMLSWKWSCNFTTRKKTVHSTARAMPKYRTNSSILCSKLQSFECKSEQLNKMQIICIARLSATEVEISKHCFNCKVLETLKQSIAARTWKTLHALPRICSLWTCYLIKFQSCKRGEAAKADRIKREKNTVAKMAWRLLVIRCANAK